MRDSVVSVLMSPDFFFRFDASRRTKAHPAALGLRARQPAELLPLVEHARRRAAARAAAGDLHKPEVLAAQARRMLKDARVRGPGRRVRRQLARLPPLRGTSTPSIASASRASPTSCARRCSRSRSASSLDVVQHESARSSICSMPTTRSSIRCSPSTTACPAPAASDDWVRVDDADQLRRGGLLPMAVFLTKNAPGLRTSPVKRGYWVAKNVLGERIPPPPAEVPELPRDEAKLDLPLREALARHRDDAELRRLPCHASIRSGWCSKASARSANAGDSDLAGPSGRRRRDVPRRQRGHGVDGLRQLHPRPPAGRFRRQPLPQAARLRPRPQPDALRRADDRGDARKLAADGYRFDSLVESIVTSPQFLNQARPDAARHRKVNTMSHENARRRQSPAPRRFRAGRCSRASASRWPCPGSNRCPAWSTARWPRPRARSRDRRSEALRRRLFMGNGINPQPLVGQGHRAPTWS